MNDDDDDDIDFNIDDDDEISGYYNDDGEKLNPNFISKPDLCTTCRKDDYSGEEEVLCNLTRLDQDGEKEFICHSYVSKFGDEEDKDEGIKF